MATLTIYPAGNGDAFLIEHRGIAVLVDGGYASTFKQYVAPDLRNLNQRGQALDLVVATHIDADHISGLLWLFTQNGPAVAPKIVGVNRVWHNSLRSLVEPLLTAASLTKGDEELLCEICRRGYAGSTDEQSDQAEISALQGSSLASLLRAGQYNWNGNDGLNAITASNTLALSDEVSLTVLSPSSEDLSKLRDWWIDELRSTGIAGVITTTSIFEDAFEFLCSYQNQRKVQSTTEIAGQSDSSQELRDVYVPDDSIINASSITFIMDLGGKRVLFLGDAWAETCESALTSISHSSLPIIFDAIKLSHHGSRRNTSPALLELVDSPRFVISTNGARHNHPDLEVLKALVDRPAQFERDIYFNSRTAASEALRSHASKSRSAFTVHDDTHCRIEIR